MLDLSVSQDPDSLVQSCRLSYHGISGMALADSVSAQEMLPSGGESWVCDGRGRERRW